MKRIIHILLISFGFSISFVSAGSGWTDYGYILSLEADDLGQVLAQVNVSSNPSHCKNKQWFHTRNKQHYQLLRDAASNDKKVRLKVTGFCHLKGYSQISVVAMEP